LRCSQPGRWINGKRRLRRPYVND